MWFLSRHLGAWQAALLRCPVVPEEPGTLYQWYRWYCTQGSGPPYRGWQHQKEHTL